jgi:dCMP deaminase
MTRPTFDRTWLAVAAVISGRATCPKLQVGAVIVDPANQIISTGYNGAAKGSPHCVDIGCDLDPLTGRCKRTVHAEMNAILQAGSPRLAGATLYLTHTPCLECATMIGQSGIVRVVWAATYGDVARAVARLHERGIETEGPGQ